MKYDLKIDAENRDIFAEWQTLNASENRHKCVLCGKKCCINGSLSFRGERLICNKCAKTKFENIEEAFKWIENGNE